MQCPNVERMSCLKHLFLAASFPVLRSKPQWTDKRGSRSLPPLPDSALHDRPGTFLLSYSSRPGLPQPLTSAMFTQEVALHFLTPAHPSARVSGVSRKRVLYFMNCISIGHFSRPTGGVCTLREHVEGKRDPVNFPGPQVLDWIIFGQHQRMLELAFFQKVCAWFTTLKSTVSCPVVKSFDPYLVRSVSRELYREKSRLAISPHSVF